MPERAKELRMSSITERLRASKHKAKASEFKLGYDLGQKWAEQSAEAAALQRLENLRDDLESQLQFDWDDFFVWSEPQVYGPDERLSFAMYPEANKGRASEDFWECVLGDAIQNSALLSELLKGFAGGAVELRLSVRDKL